MSLNTPDDLNITGIEINDESFRSFTKQVGQWVSWFEQFFDIFHYIIEWLRNFHIDGIAELCFAIKNNRNKNTTTVIEMTKTVEKIMEFLVPMNNLERLCQILNCLTPFKVIEKSIADQNQNSKEYIQELKRFHRHNSFVVDSRVNISQKYSIDNRQNIRWSLASEKQLCDINVWFKRMGSLDNGIPLFAKKDYPIDRFVLHGEFETLYPGELIIEIINQRYNPRTIWYDIKQNDLPVSCLFQGIVRSSYAKEIARREPLDIAEFTDKLDNTIFPFIDRILDENTGLTQMTGLEDIFCSRSIDIPFEVAKLYTNRLANINQKPTEEQIAQVCEKLKIFQYYSHIKIIIDCITKFDIISNATNINTIDRLKELSNKEEFTLEKISQVCGISAEKFRDISSKHLDLIKTANECSTIIEMMREFDLYSVDGRHRFQELRDNLTIQFQLQERNDIMLNSFIVTYALCEPFVLKATTLKTFVDRVIDVSKFDTSSLKHMIGKISCATYSVTSMSS